MQTTTTKFPHHIDNYSSPPKRNAKQPYGKAIHIKTQNEQQKTTNFFHSQINTFHNNGVVIPLGRESPPPFKRFLHSKNAFYKQQQHDCSPVKITSNKMSSYSPVQLKAFLPIVNENGFNIGNGKENGNSNGFNDHLVNDYYKFYPNAKTSTHITTITTTTNNPPNCNLIKGYGTNTYRGLVRNYNEDRVAINFNMKSSTSDLNSKWPKDLTVSFFAIYDGHAGDKCSEYLKNNLHNFILKDPSFPLDPNKALKNGFENAETAYMNNNYKNKTIIDYSGSCALVVLIVNTLCYIANVGDSRGIYSYNSGTECYQLTRDHKPNDPIEKQRIVKEGGSIYRATAIGMQNLPWRIFPGKLSVSRAFGDLEAKLPLYGGNPKVLISSPTISTIKLDDKSDFIILGCDGIYDKLSNEEIIAMAWSMKKKNVEVTNIHQHCGLVTDAIMKYSLKRFTVDNISCIFIAFENFTKRMLELPFEYPLNKKYSVVQMKESQEVYMSEDKERSSNAFTAKSNSSQSFLPLINTNTNSNSNNK